MDYNRMPARERNHLILLRTGLDERKDRLEREATKTAKRKRGR